MTRLPALGEHRPVAEILARMRQLHPRLIDLSLDRLLRLLAALDNPHRKLPPVVHIAGTNGKGSTLAYMRAALEAAGRRVHVYTSPYLVRFNERIRLAGTLIEDDYLIDLLTRLEDVNDGLQITEFEITTAAAFLAFSEVAGDILLLETGLGGIFDATNVIPDPRLTIITTISYDHQQFLGDTLASIAANKAGILKTGSVCVLGPQDPEAMAVIATRARTVGAPLVRHGADWQIERNDDGLEFRYRGQPLHCPPAALRGVHQSLNAGLALASLEQLLEFGFSDANLRAGVTNADWPGRLQRLTIGPLPDLLPANCELWFDGGHNPGAGQVLAETLEGWRQRDADDIPLHLVIAMLSSKDAQGFLTPFCALQPVVHTIPFPAGHDAVPPADLARAASDLGMAAHAAGSIEAALETIVSWSTGAPRRILICGSLYLGGEVLEKNG